MTNRSRFDAGAPHAPAAAEEWGRLISDAVDDLAASGTNGHAPDPALEDDGQTLITQTGDYLFLPGVTWLEEGADDSHIPAGTLIIEVEALTAPDTPSGLTAISASDTQINLEWDAVLQAGGYEYRVDGGTPVDVGLNVTAEVTGLTAGTSYDFEVRAYNDAGTSDWSAVVSQSTQAEPAAPDAPTNLDATGGDEQVTLTWTPSSEATGHRVYRHTSDNFGSASQVGSDLGSSADEYLDTTVINDTEYFYWVTAFNAVGESDPSTVDSATPTETVGTFTDFSDDPIGVGAPDGWTSILGDASNWEIIDDGDGGRALRTLGSSSENNAIRWDDPGSGDDVEILALMEQDDDNSSIAELMARIVDNENYYRADMEPRENIIRLRTVVNGSVVESWDAAFTHGTNQKVWMRMRCEGTTIRIKAWLDGDAEPGSWQIEEADSSHSSGHVGVRRFRASATWHQVSANMDGGTAPSEA